MIQLCQNFKETESKKKEINDQQHNDSSINKTKNKHMDQSRWKYFQKSDASDFVENG